MSPSLCPFLACEHQCSLKQHFWIYFYPREVPEMFTSFNSNQNTCIERLLLDFSQVPWSSLTHVLRNYFTKDRCKYEKYYDYIDFFYLLGTAASAVLCSSFNILSISSFKSFLFNTKVSRVEQSLSESSSISVSFLPLSGYHSFIIS